MLSFLKRWFSRRGRREEIEGQQPLPGLDPHARAAAMMPRMRRADVHRLMIEATALRRREGYHQAVLFLRQLAEEYLREGNTALITTLNKLVPYLKKDSETSYTEAKEWMEGILSRLPQRDPYFLNAHITMAELLQHEGTEQSVAYLQHFLRDHPPSVDTYYHLIRLADFHRELSELDTAAARMDEALDLWDTSLDRYRLIRMQRRWHRSMALLALAGEEDHDYLFHRFMEFALDMARILDPARISDFHHRKDQYYKGERGFAGTHPYESVMELPVWKDKKEKILKDIYGFVFEEMPLLLGVTEKELHYRPGDPESLEEVRHKKLFATLPFTQHDLLARRIRQVITPS